MALRKPSAEEYDSLFDEDPYSEIENSGEEHTGHEDFEGELEMENSTDGNSGHENGTIKPRDKKFKEKKTTPTITATTTSDF